MLKAVIVLVIFLITTILSAQEDKYNVLFIAVDDLKPMLNCYGEQQIISPNIDQLAESGMVFNNAFCQWSVCGPSRASLLSGLTPDATGIRNLRFQLREENPSVVTLPEYFKNNGYMTAAAGKIFDGRNVDAGHDSLSWSLPYTPPGSYSYPQEYGEFIKGQYRVEFKTATEKGPDGVDYDGYEDGQICLDAISKMEYLAGLDTSFFLAVGFKKPHIPFIAPAKYWDFYERDSLRLEPFQRFANGSPHFAYHKPEPLNYNDIPKEWIYTDEKLGNGILNPEAQRKLLHGYYACVSYIDDLVGKLITELKYNKLYKNTVIVLWGDHGYHLGDHNQWGKHTNFEQAVRVPLIIYSPDGVGGYSNETVELTDLYPTLLELTGNDVPDFLHGHSLVPLLKGENMYKTCAVSEYRSKGYSSYSFRTEQYRLILWNENANVRTDVSSWNPDNIIHVELYDYVTDPKEQQNIASDKNYKNVLDSMMAIAHNWWYEQNIIIKSERNPAYVEDFNYFFYSADFENGSNVSWNLEKKLEHPVELQESIDSLHGVKAMKITMKHAGNNWEDVFIASDFQPCFSGIRGREVKLQGYAKSVEVNQFVRIRVIAKNFNGVENEIQSEILPLNNNYQPFLLSFTMPEATDQWKILIEYGKSKGDIFFGNFTLKQNVFIDDLQNTIAK
jgi:arylsulfatase A-like enzyme